MSMPATSRNECKNDFPDGLPDGNTIYVFVDGALLSLDDGKTTHH